MRQSGTAEIETPRLLLRPFKTGDAAAVFRNWASDEKTTEFLRWPAHKSVETTQRVLDEWITAYDKQNYYQWAIVFKEKVEEPIGSISVVEQNERLGMAHIGYCVGRKWWRQGIASEALSGVISFLFNAVKVNRIEAQHDPDNPNSGKVMEKCGMRYEGTRRQADFNNRGIVDAAMYSLLASEYYANQKA